MSLPKTELFTGTNGTAIHTYDANWVVNSGGFGIQTNAISPNSAGNECGAHWAGDTFGNDQYAKGTLAALSVGVAIGPAVRLAASAATYYGFYADGTDSYLFKMVAGTWTQLATNAANGTVNDLMEIDVTGTSLTAKIGGVTLMGPSTDSAIASGSAGITAFGNGSGTRFDSVELGNLGSSPTTVTLTAAALTAGAQTLSVVPGAATISLAAAAMVAGPQTLTVVPGAISVAFAAAALVAGPQTITPVPGAATVALTQAALSAAAQTLIASTPQTIALATAALAAGAQTLTPVPGAVAIALTAAVLSAGPQTLSSGGLTIVSLAAAALTGAPQGLTVVPGAALIVLTRADLAAAAQTLTVVPGAKLIALTAAALAAGAQTLTPVPGQAVVSLTSAQLAAGAQTLDIHPGVVAILLAAAALAVQAQGLPGQTGVVRGLVVLSEALAASLSLSESAPMASLSESLVFLVTLSES